MTLTETREVVSLRGITVRVGDAQPLNHLDLDIDHGSIVAVVGPNGAGKTTLLDVITRDVPASGSVSAPPPSRIARVFQGSPLPDTLTVGELLDVVTGDDERTHELARAFG